MRAVLLAAVVAAGCSSDPASSSGRAYTWRFVDPDSGATVACPALVDRIEILVTYEPTRVGECNGVVAQTAADETFPCAQSQATIQLTPAHVTSCISGDFVGVLIRAMTADGAIYSESSSDHADLEAKHGLIQISWHLLAADGTSPGTCTAGYQVTTSLGGAAACATDGRVYAIGQRAGAYDLDVILTPPPPLSASVMTTLTGVAVTPDQTTSVAATLRLH